MHEHMHGLQYKLPQYKLAHFAGCCSDLSVPQKMNQHEQRLSVCIGTEHGLVNAATLGRLWAHAYSYVMLQDVPHKADV